MLLLLSFMGDTFKPWAAAGKAKIDAKTHASTKSDIGTSENKRSRNRDSSVRQAGERALTLLSVAEKDAAGHPP